MDPLPRLLGCILLVSVVAPGCAPSPTNDSPPPAAPQPPSARQAPSEAAPAGLELSVAWLQGAGPRLQTLLLRAPPHGPRPSAAALILQGLGCHSVADAPPRPSPYAGLARGLAQGALVCLRVELPGVAGSSGGPCADLDLPALEAVFLRAYDSLAAAPGVDPQRIVLVGHSLGAVLAARLAAQRPVAAVVALGVSPLSWTEYTLETTRRQLEAKGLPYPMVERLVGLEARFVHRLIVEGQAPAAIAASSAELGRYLRDTRRDGERVWGHHYSLFQQLGRINQAAQWSALPAPLVAIWGAEDLVTARQDHERLVAMVNRAHPGHARLVVLPGVDHALRRAVPPDAVESSAVAATRRYAADVHVAILAALSDPLALRPAP